MDALHEAVARERPSFLRRLHGEVRVETVRQRWFARHRILEVESALPLPPARIHVALSRAGQVLVLSGQLGNLQRMAAADPPRGIRTATRARAFANRVLSWTEEPSLAIGSFDEVAWRQDREALERIEILRRLLAHRIHPQRVVPSPAGFFIATWLIDRRRLVHREVVVPRSGVIEKTDTTVERDLPC